MLQLSTLGPLIGSFLGFDWLFNGAESVLLVDKAQVWWEQGVTPHQIVVHTLV